MINLFKNKHLLFLTLVHFAINIPWLLNFHGIYWDDWITFNNSHETIKQLTNILGLPIFYYYDYILSSIGDGVYSFKLAIFFEQLAVIGFIYYILKSFKNINENIVFLIVLLYEVLPIATSILWKSISIFFFGTFLFYLAFLLLTIFVKNNNFKLRILILTIFYLSFWTNSLLVYYSLVLLYIYYYKFYNLDDKLLLKVKKMIIGYYDFILLPVIFFIVKQIYFQPYDLYAGYNHLNFNLLNIIVSECKNIYYIFIKLNIVSFSNLLSIYNIAIFAIVTYIVYKLYIKDNIVIKFNTKKQWFLIGFLMVIIALFPYSVVGKVGGVFNCSDRFHLLVPFGIAILTISFLFIIIKNQKILYISIVSIILVFSFMSIKIRYNNLVDSYYTLSLVNNFRLSNIIRNNTTFIVTNKIKNKLVYHRDLSFYELNGRLRMAFDNAKRLMININIENFEVIKKFKGYKQYNFSEWKYQKPIYLNINISQNINIYDVLNLIYLDFMNKNAFIHKINKLVSIALTSKIYYGNSDE